MPYDTFASELPYPDIECAENIADAKLLMPLYGGPAGELTAVTTYCFQSYVTTRNKEIAAAVGGIAKTEMHHHALLGHAIVGLGGYPVMGGRTYWSGSFPNYTLDPKKFLRENIAAHAPARRPDCLYVSLGDREERTRNPVLSSVRRETEAVVALFRAWGVPTALEFPPGNHFQDVAKRTARGVRWLLEN